MDDETRIERRARAQTLASLFQAQGPTRELMAVLRSRAELSERYQVPGREDREDRLRRLMARARLDRAHVRH